MPKAKAITLAPVASDVDYISTTETLTTPWVLQADGVLDLSANPQHVTITCTSDETLATFTIVGTDRYKNVLTESLAGPNNGVVVSVGNFATVVSITSTADATGVTAGVDGTCESGWYVLNYRGPDFNVGIGCDVSSGAAATYAMQHTFHNILASGFVEDDAVVHTHDTITGQTGTADGNYTNPPTATRLAITAHTSGTVNARIIHAGGV